MKDSLGDRMKSNYEDRFRFSLCRRAYTIIRVDGKAFHTYTHGLERPFDLGLMDDMNATAAHLCKNIQGAQFAYVQSDEISLLLTDFATHETDAWFDNNLQKMCSISASLATSSFNGHRLNRYFENHKAGQEMKWANFDSRVFQVPSKSEVENYFIWRQQDATRNSISSVAQSLYSPKQLHGKNTNEQQEMIFAKGINWNDYPSESKRGRMVIKVEYPHKETVRTKWDMAEVPIFTQNRQSLSNMIPSNE